ncbi:MAG: hypothetical protein BM560_20170 [Roseobacter sp. MedPE-SWde]|nr:MAG: hypothetical protein BM560_20170 [Roseobacter sp. MedPE-SWde]
MAGTTLSKDPRDFMATVDETLESCFPPYGAAKGEVLMAIMHFSPVWSIFEFRAVNRDAHQGSIEAFAQRCVPSNEQIREFQPAFDHFKKRYINGRRTNAEFDSLVGGDTEIRKAIEEALLELESSNIVKLTGLLLITYCLRNNLFHGTKWHLGLEDQYENLAFGTLVLVETLSAFPIELGRA